MDAQFLRTNCRTRLSVAFAVACLALPDLQAAPVTFQFDAEINTVFLNSPFDSGVDFAVGDNVLGRFSFEPDEGDGGRTYSATQPFTFSLGINGTVVSTASFLIRTFDDSPVADSPLASVVDIVEVGGEVFPATNGAGSGNFDSAHSGFGMELWSAQSLPGYPDSLETASIPGTSEVWNRFTLRRELRVILGDGNGGSIGFRATVGPLTTIPEPQSICLASLAIVFCRIIACGKSKKWNQ
jgi:hypothetical protein